MGDSGAERGGSAGADLQETMVLHETMAFLEEPSPCDRTQCSGGTTLVKKATHENKRPAMMGRGMQHSNLKGYDKLCHTTNSASEYAPEWPP